MKMIFPAWHVRSSPRNQTMGRLPIPCPGHYERNTMHTFFVGALTFEVVALLMVLAGCTCLY
jgi:hypothetical protein